MPGRRLHSHPVQHRQGCTRSHVGEHKSGRGCIRHPGSPLTLTPNPSLARHEATEATQRHAAWGGTTMSRPMPGSPPPIGHAAPRTRQQRPHQRCEHASKQAGAKGRRDHTVPPPPRERTQASTQTPKGEHNPNANTQPNHPPIKHAHSKPKLPPPREHKSAHATARGQARCVSAGTRGRVGDRHEAKQAKPPQSGHAGQAHTKTRKQWGLRRVPPCARPTGGEPRAKGRSQ